MPRKCKNCIHWVKRRGEIIMNLDGVEYRDCVLYDGGKTHNVETPSGLYACKDWKRVA